MSDEVWPGTSVAELSESDFEELYDLLEKQDPAAGHHGGAVARLATFLGLWRTLQGANLRIGLKQANVFVSAETAGPADMVQVGDKVRLILRQLFVPDLPHERCVVQLTWRASHWFSREEKGGYCPCHILRCRRSRQRSRDRPADFRRVEGPRRPDRRSRHVRDGRSRQPTYP